MPIQAYNSTTGILPTSPSQAFVAQHNPPGRGGDHNFSQGRGGDRGFSNPRNIQGRNNFCSNNNCPNSSRNNSQRYNCGGRSSFNFSRRRIPCQICC
ncbi:hypothetical protein ACFX2A_003925 [Malus domestica]